MSKVKTSLRVFDPEGAYHNKVLALAKWHHKDNPDGLESVRDAGLRSGLTWMLRHLIDQETHRMNLLKEVDKQIDKQIHHPPPTTTKP